MDEVNGQITCGCANIAYCSVCHLCSIITLIFFVFFSPICHHFMFCFSTFKIRFIKLDRLANCNLDITCTSHVLIILNHELTQLGLFARRDNRANSI